MFTLTHFTLLIVCEVGGADELSSEGPTFIYFTDRILNDFDHFKD